jgi:predicted proteasome-type protease
VVRQHAAAAGIVRCAIACVDSCIASTADVGMPLLSFFECDKLSAEVVIDTSDCAIVVAGTARARDVRCGT